MSEGLHSIGLDLRTIDVPDMPRTSGPDVSVATLERGEGMLVMHGGPDHLGVLLPLIGRSRLSRKRIVGHWAWELPAIPPSWIPSLAYVDEVWTPSQFVASAFQSATTKSVRVVPYPVAILPPGQRQRSVFGINEERFVVLSVFTVGSCFERKNPIAAIKAFRLAFGNTPGAELILKVPDLNDLPAARHDLREAIASSANIRVLEANLDRPAMRDLIASADVVLSLHRAEGFGLVMAEAMHSGTAVIASNWSGNLDYMTDETAGLVEVSLIDVHDPYGQWKCSGRWADPDVDHAAALLGRFARHPDHVQEVRARARVLVAHRLGLAGFRAAVAPALA